MNRYFKYIIAGLALVFALQSCYKDQGNYDYEQLVPIVIDPSSFAPAVSLPQQTLLTISPQVSQGGNNANLAYEWRLLDNLNVPDPNTGVFINEVIGRERVLNYVLDLPARSYHLLLYVTDTTNDVTEFIRIALNVESIAPPGWMVLSGNNTSGDVSIVVNPMINATIAGFSKDEVTHRIFSDNNEGRRAQGAPAMVWHSRGNDGNHVYVFTHGSTGGYRTAATDLMVIDNYREIFRNMPAEDVSFEGFATWSFNELLVNNGDVYYISQNESNRFFQFGVRCFGQPYRAAPYIGTHRTGNLYGVFYDMDGRRFMHLNWQQDVLLFANTNGAAFNPNNVGKDMFYAEMGFPANYWYCIMQDGNNTSTRMLYTMDLTRAWWDASANFGARIDDISGATDMAASKYFAFGMRGYVMYHATDMRIYSNNFNGDRTSTLIYDVAAAYAGYEITCMQMYKHTENTVYDSRLLMVGIHNPATNDGKLLQFSVNEINGTLDEPAPKVYEGFERIVSMGYKWK
ncbi:MAG: PKD-like family lipoprotein [Rikenellaceae bacterium]|nr:PKD-like family lipoprotein [Rikenellaceae bacterium]MCL2692260.1 PKD-like family lipoprotein [Rikenellaceae bacterium]